MKTRLHLLAASLMAAGFFLFISAPLFVVPVSAAATPPKTTTKATEKRSTQDISQSVTHSYSAESTVQLGMLVKLKQKGSGTVEPVTEATIAELLGVVVRPNETTISLSPQTATVQQVYVASTGQYSTLVSNQNGPIKTGDYITISALNGIGMKADKGQSIILGKAVGVFTGSSNVIGKVTVKDQKGKATDVSVARIIVNLDISHNPLENTATDKVPGFLNKAAVTVSGKPVSAARIYLGIVTLIVSAFVAGIVVYSGVRNGMVSVGRNPLSKKSIVKSLIQTIIGGLIIFTAGIFATYVLLKL